MLDFVEEHMKELKAIELHWDVALRQEALRALLEVGRNDWLQTYLNAREGVGKEVYWKKQNQMQGLEGKNLDVEGHVMT
jgi:hypothetical protein